MNHPLPDLLTRRETLQRMGTGLGALGLAGILAGDDSLVGASAPHSSSTLSPKHSHFAPRAKHIIHLFMNGGPSQVDTFDPKPALEQFHGQRPASADLKTERKTGGLLKSPFRFQRYGESGIPVSDLFPEIGSCIDDICVIRSMHTNIPNHEPSLLMMCSGETQPTRPAMGSWLLYGLGSENQNLPGFVVLTSVGGGQSQPIAARQWHSGFLPSRYQGVQFRSTGDPVLYVSRPEGVAAGPQEDVLSAVSQLNRLRQDTTGDPEIETRIAQYELAFRMQRSVPELMDISDEPAHILDLYGTEGGDGSFAANCLLARRLAERGVRFIHLYHRGWDHHGGVQEGVAKTAGLVDQGTAALLTDLKQRDMLKDTLVIWSGEFGRTPMAQGNGRDHHIKGFSLWMAGGGIRGGMSWGATDELGYHAVDNVFHVHDLHATMLHLLGIDHERLTYRFQGRDFRLTDVHGRVVEPLLA